MKSLFAALTIVISMSAFADVCQVKPSGVLKDDGIFESINLWSLKKGDQTIKDYTFHEPDFSKAITERNALISAGLCQEEPVLEKCKLEIERHNSFVYVVVYIGQAKALALGGQSEFDMRTLDVAANHIEQLATSAVCTR